jgi:hypothetical protein
MVFERKDLEGTTIKGWWFRDTRDYLIGPFTSRAAAEISYEQDRETKTRDDAMNYPVYERQDMWWFRDEETDMEYGPYETRDEAIEAFEESFGFPEGGV